MGKLAFVFALALLDGCGSGCKKTPATMVAVAYTDPCLTAMPAGQGDTCGMLANITVDNLCSMDWTNSGGILVKAGETGHNFTTQQAKVNGNLYQIIGTIGTKSAVVSFQVPPPPN